MTNLKKSANIDKPWEDEPNKDSGIFCGLDWSIKRNHSGAWCGYVKMPPGELHKADDIDVHVHGGLTFEEVDPKDNRQVFGFDCAHLDDLLPILVGMPDMPRGLFEDAVYRDIDYVTDQCKRLCWQLAGNTFHGKFNEALYQEFKNKNS